MTVWQKAANAARSWLEDSRKVGPPPAPTPAARPFSVPRGGSGTGVRPATVSRPPIPTGHATWASRGNCRLPRSDRRRHDRRGINQGAPYGAERRSGRDDRQGDRRRAARGESGIGLMRDYFSQSEAHVTTIGTGLPPEHLVRFHD